MGLPDVAVHDHRGGPRRLHPQELAGVIGKGKVILSLANEKVRLLIRALTRRTLQSLWRPMP